MKIDKIRLSEPGLWKIACAVVWFFAVTALSLSAQTFTSLVNFENTNGNGPNSPLIQGFDGDFYGATSGGGARGDGAIFRMIPPGKLTALYSFCSVQPACADGSNPSAGVVQAANGKFYGTTFHGGAYCNSGYGLGCGTVFAITAKGTLTTLYNFCSQTNCPDGAWPFAMLHGSDGNLYGVTSYQQGSIFRVTPAGQLTTLYTFCSKLKCGDGSLPNSLVQGSDGNFYGSTSDGGGFYCGLGYQCGTIFRISPAGKLTTIYRFPPGSANGWSPIGGLVQGSDENFYGATLEGGANASGTIFKLTPQGQFTLLYSFCAQGSCTDGSFPVGSLVQGTDGNFYGSTDQGGIFSCGYYGQGGCGTLFQLTPSGTLTTLHTFVSTDGEEPQSMLQGTDGNFYGTTLIGGDHSCYGGSGCGTVFSLSMGLGPFVSLARRSGIVGQSGGILGRGFTGTTAVSFNGTAASFTVVSDTYIRATVPVGATSGFVSVNTPGGILTSNVPFQVAP